MKAPNPLIGCLLALWMLSAGAQMAPLGNKAYLPEMYNPVPADKRTGSYMVALLREGWEFPGGFLCGASIVADGWVLTAAHCLFDSNCKKLQFTDLYAIGGGLPLMPGLPRMNATAVRPHPGFRCMPFEEMIAAFNAGQPIPMGNDIGLVRVEGIKVSEPALIVAKDGAASAAPLVASGWGTLGNGAGISSKLNSVSLTVVSTSTCVQAWYPSTLSPDQLCVGPPKLSPLAGVCSGDSGGPLVATLDFNRVQAGLVSLGHLVCNVVDRPSLFTNVLTHRPWIESNVGVGKLADGSKTCTKAMEAAGIC